MFITSSLLTPNPRTRGEPGLPGYWKDVHSSRHNFHQGPLEFMALSTRTFNSGRCAKGKDVKSQSSYPEKKLYKLIRKRQSLFAFSFLSYKYI